MKHMKLSEICEYTTKRIETKSLGVDNYISTENMLQNKGGVVAAAKVPAEKAVAFNPGDILISNIRPYFKKIWHADKRGGCSSDVLCLRALSGIDKTYLYYLLSQDSFFEYVMSGAKGSKMPRGDKAQIMNWEVSIPDFAEQKRVGEFLNSIDDKIALNNRINHNLEEQAQALYKSWFVDFDPFKDGEFEDSEMGLIPAGWSIQTLDSLSSIISRGFSPNYNENSKDLVLGQRCVRNNLIDISLARKHNPKILGERELKKWDILINSTGMGSLGRVAQIFFEPKRLTFDSHLTLVRAKKDCYKQFVGRNLLARQDEIENMAVGSTGQTELPRDRVRAMSIICPPESVMRSFGLIIEALSKAIQSNIEMNESLSRDRDVLLPKLMSGEISIS